MRNLTSIWYCFLLLLVQYAGLDPAFGASASQLPWEGPLEILTNSLTGPVAAAISIIGVAVAGGTLVFNGDMSEFAKRACLLVIAISLLLGGASLINALFPNSASGALL